MDSAMLAGSCAILAASFVAPTGITYRLEALTGGLRQLRTTYDAAELILLEKLNRVDLDHLARLDRYVRPDVWVSDELAYSPLPRSYEAAVCAPKAIVVHQPAQVFGAYEYGRLVRWGPVSSGRALNPTPPGQYHLTWKAIGRSSTVNPEWFMRWDFNFDNARGFSFHEYALPGHPASHSCVRLLQVDAQWLFRWGEGWRLDRSGRIAIGSGTPVSIVGRYDFAAPPPWRSPAWLARGVDLPQE